MNIFPLPLEVVRHIDKLCRAFLWTGREVVGRKAPVAWSRICDPKNSGGLGVIDLGIWRLACSLKMLWSIEKKKEKLWVKWIHSFFLKGVELMDYEPKTGCSWFLRSIMKSRQKGREIDLWMQAGEGDKFPTKKIYMLLRGEKENVVWRKLFFSNGARPRAKFILWLLCHGRLSTKERLQKFGVNVDIGCCFCGEPETAAHLFFGCTFSLGVWRGVLEWLKIKHCPKCWGEELEWIIDVCKGDSARARLVKISLAETVYLIWKMRNEIVFQTKEKKKDLWKEVCRVVAVRGVKRKGMQHVLMQLDGRI